MEAKKLSFGLALIVPLLLASVVMATGTESAQATASVTVNEYIDITISANTLAYNAGDPGATVEVSGQGTESPAVTITVNPTTNVNVNLETSGTAYSGAGTIAVGQTEYCVDNYTCNPKTALSLTATSFKPIVVDGTSKSTNLWYWLNIPSGFVPAGTYSSTYTFSASKTQ